MFIIAALLQLGLIVQIRDCRGVLFVFFGQETCHIGPARGADAFGHSAAFCIGLYSARFDRFLLSTLNAITFEIHL